VDIHRLRQLRRDLVQLVTELGDASSLRGPDAKRILSELVGIQRAAVAGKLTVQRRAVSTSVWRTDGASSPETWLATLTGETPADAARSLTAGQQIAELPATAALLAEGELSETQATLVASGASVDRTAEHALLETARRSSTGELKRKSRAARQAAMGRQAVDRDRIHRTRYLRTWTSDDGAFEGKFRLTPDHGAVLQSALESAQSAVFARARKDGLREGADAYAADALLDLAMGGGSSAAGDRSTDPRALIRVRVDQTALVRGRTVAGETCEIEGVGPASVDTALGLACDAVIEAVLLDKGQLVKVVPLGRTIPAATRRLLLERDQICVVPGCGRRRFLEIHHIKPYSLGGKADLANLARICHFHHDQITHQGARLSGCHPTWEWQPPDPVAVGPDMTPDTS
jgi:hypothetical protein